MITSDIIQVRRGCRWPLLSRIKGATPCFENQESSCKKKQHCCLRLSAFKSFAVPFCSDCILSSPVFKINRQHVILRYTSALEFRYQQGCFYLCFIFIFFIFMKVHSAQDSWSFFMAFMAYESILKLWKTSVIISNFFFNRKEHFVCLYVWMLWHRLGKIIPLVIMEIQRIYDMKFNHVF